MIERLKVMLSGGATVTGVPARAPAVPPGERVYAVGDVHGRLDLLQTLLDWVEADDVLRRPAATTIVLIGDLVDRGPESAQVIAHLLTRDWKPRAVRFVQGNHEEVMLQALGGDAQALRYWLQIGGAAAMRSYGVPQRVLDGATGPLHKELVARVPRDHVAFLEGMEDRLEIGGYIFVHAGVRPGLALDRQSGADLRWIRREFLEHEGDHGKVVVHGHSISHEVEDRGNRIGIDTGAYATGRLSALVLEGEERRILTT